MGKIHNRRRSRGGRLFLGVALNGCNRDVTSAPNEVDSAAAARNERRGASARSA